MQEYDYDNIINATFDKHQKEVFFYLKEGINLKNQFFTLKKIESSMWSVARYFYNTALLFKNTLPKTREALFAQEPAAPLKEILSEIKDNLKHVRDNIKFANFFHNYKEETGQNIMRLLDDVVDKNYKYFYNDDARGVVEELAKNYSGEVSEILEDNFWKNMKRMWSIGRICAKSEKELEKISKILDDFETLLKQNSDEEAVNLLGWEEIYSDYLMQIRELAKLLSGFYLRCYNYLFVNDYGED